MIAPYVKLSIHDYDPAQIAIHLTLYVGYETIELGLFKGMKHID